MYLSKGRASAVIYYFSPYDTQKRIGHAHNEMVQLVQDPEAWICITDPDTMFLTPDYGRILEGVVEEFGDRFQLFGCLTNRLGLKHQLHGGQCSENPDISHHLELARSCASDNRVVPCYLVAGMFMLFQKKTWSLAGGFRPSIYFDKQFSAAVINAGGQLGIIQSLYIFHVYRWGKKNLGFEVGHLG